MKETLTCDIWTGEKVNVIIDRETGEFSLFGSSFKLNIQDNIAVLIDNEVKGEVVTGFMQGKTWRFEEPSFIIEDQNHAVRENDDPFVAVIQLLYDVVRTS